MPLPDDALAVLIDCFIASGEPSSGTWSARLWGGARGVGGNGVADERESSRHNALCLLGSNDVPRRGD